MRLLSVVMVLSLCGPAAAQNGQGESEYRGLLAQGAGAKTVAEAKSGALPAGTPLRVFVLAPAQNDVWYIFAERVEEWNRTEGERYGRVEVVSEASRADVILARFLTPFKTKKHAPPPGDEPWIAGGSTDARTRPSLPMPGPGATVSRTLPALSHTAKVYTYIAAREGDGLKLLWRGDDTVRVSGVRRVPRTGLGALKGGKDSKFAGDKLRDQFFKMLKSRGRGRV